MIELKKKQKEKKKDQQGSGKRKASATSTDKDEAATDDVTDNGDDDDTAQVGNEFGCGAYSKKKKVTIASMARIAERTGPTKATQRYVMMASTRRVIFSSDTISGSEGRVELDTHVDTCVTGKNTVVLDLTGKVVSVSPFSDQYEAMEDVPVATVATAYDCPTTGKTHILVINEALYFGDKMSNTLLCPNQLQHNGLKVDDCTKAV